MHIQATTMVASGDRVTALEALSVDQIRQLAAFANICGRGLGVDGQDLLQAAYQRWLASDVAVGSTEETTRYLFGAIKSIKSNEVRRQRSEKAAFGARLEPDMSDEEAEDPVELIPSGSSAAEEMVYAQQVYDALDDPELQLLILHLAEGTPRKEIQAELGWDDNKYDAVQKRKIRTLAKLLKEGKI